MGEEEDLLAVSQALGRDVFAIQGGGGNSSFKRADGVMLVKASGRAMGELTDMGGFVAVDPAGLRAGLAACAAEADYAALLAACVVGAGGRPSIETGLHALMGRCVLHSHSLWANVLCCAHGGQGLLADLFPAADYVPYAMPGLPLAQALAARAPLADVVFLENHGLIVSADTPQAALARHDAVVAADGGYARRWRGWDGGARRRACHAGAVSGCGGVSGQPGAGVQCGWPADVGRASLFAGGHGGAGPVAAPAVQC